MSDLLNLICEGEGLNHAEKWMLFVNSRHYSYVQLIRNKGIYLNISNQNLLKGAPPTKDGPVAVTTPGLVWIPGEIGSRSIPNPGLAPTTLVP